MQDEKMQTFVVNFRNSPVREGFLRYTPPDNKEATDDMIKLRGFVK